MSKNGGKPRDTFPTLEEALRKFARERGLGPKKDDPAISNVHYADFAFRREQLKSDDPDDFGFDHQEQIVPLIDGIPQTLQELERIAAQELLRNEFSVLAESLPEAEDSVDLDEPALPATRIASPNWRRDFAISAVGAALMIFAAIFVTRPPHMRQNLPELLSQTISTNPLKAGTDVDGGDSITTMVILADSDVTPAPHHRLKPTELESNIKNELKSRAFPDIGVSVGAKGETYLAGQVYSIDEAEKIRDLVKQVRGVRRVHFLHPDVISADGPAYFGATTGWAPDVWGAKIDAVFIGSPADKAGLHPGDVISAFDGQTIPDGETLNSLVASYHPGQRVEFRVWHKGEAEYLVVRMGEMTTMAAR
jgi:PDZ domain-containing protein